jgi:predicted TIM-barrel fold metal-dependent hydrolase
MGFLSDDDKSRLMPAELLPHETPIPTQLISSDEFYPYPQTSKLRELQSRLLDIGDAQSKKQGMSRRRFFQSAAGMAAAYVALNETFGSFFSASRAESATPELAQQRADSLKHQFIMDMHTHFLRNDTRLTQFIGLRESVGRAGWNSDLVGKEQTLEDVKYDNYIKEVYLDSDTKVALISSSPSDIERDWFLTNEMMAQTREKVNKHFGSRRMLSHAVFTPGQPGWLEKVDAALLLKPDSMKGYTVGDNTHKDLSRYPWRMDDEKVAYKAYEKFAKAGIKNVCVHKGLFPPTQGEKYPRLLPYADASDVGKAAKDWPQLNFIIYHGAYRHVGGDPKVALDEFEKTGRISWTSDLCDVPEKYGVSNVYADVGQLFAWTMIAQPRVTAALMGEMIKRLGTDKVVWGTDAVWTGGPQWQIEGMRRLEIPEDMQAKYGYAPLGPADGPVKSAIFSGNNARLYSIDVKRAALEASTDGLAALKADYEANGPGRSNLRYGYVAAPPTNG